MLKQILLAALCIVFLSCANKKPVDERAAAIVKECIVAHGGNNYKDMDVSFDFRQFRVHLKQQGGKFLYERTSTDSLKNVIVDVLTNDEFRRVINGKVQELTETDKEKYREGLNAIAYFALLPYKLSEPAVRLAYKGEYTIDHKKYDKIFVSFDAAGGGKDHQDEFCFWINQAGRTMDYLSYASGGPRFRKALKRTTIDGVVFQDYENYAIADTLISPVLYDSVFSTGNVKLLSLIEQQNYSANE